MFTNELFRIEVFCVLFIYLFICLFVHSYIHLFSCLFVCLFLDSFICLFIYLFFSKSDLKFLGHLPVGSDTDEMFIAAYLF